MPIDKRIPRVLNSDNDNKAIDKVSMLDALNLYSGPDNDGFSVDGKKSDAGSQVLKNIKGNVKVIEGEALPVNARLIGSVEDPKTDITYLFIYSTQASGHGIWAYDRYGNLPDTAENSLRLIYKSKQFNFPANGFVKADIVYSNAVQTFSSLGVDFDKDAIIYFTDGKNEPRKINAYRAFQAGGESIHGGNPYAEADFITACPKTPVKPIEFEFGFDSSRSTSNFTTTPGFQFAYQYVYIDGMESSISPYSDVAYPPSVVFQGSQSFVNHNNYNVCNLRIPLPVPLAGNEISAIKILAKQGTTGSFLIVDELEFGDADISNLIDVLNEEIAYPFFNDRIGTGVSQDEVNKQFDSVPKKAVTQTVSSNRLMYGNYTDGFDSVKTSCTATVLYKESPESFLSYDVKVTPSIEPITTTSANLGKSVGFVLDFSEMPSELAEGVELSLSVTMAPDRNWHAYTFKNTNGVAASFHQTRQFGPQTQEGIDNGYNNVNFQQSLAETDSDAGAEHENIPSIFGNGNGVAPSSQAWNTVDTTDASNEPLGLSQDTAYGTSAANPIILKGGAVTFFAKIKTTQEISSNTQQKINQAFKKALLNQSNEQGFEVLEVQSTDSYNFDVGLYSGKRIKQDQIFASVSNTDAEARLICAVKTYAVNTTNPPGGFFIINKANVEMELKEVDYDNYPFVSETSNHFRLKLKSVNDPEIYTCIHATTSSNDELHPLDWIAISRQDLIEIETSSLSIGDWLASKGFNPDLNFHQNPLDLGDTFDNVITPFQTTAKQIGYLKLSSAFDLSEEVSLMDGEGGPGGGPSNSADSSINSYDYWKLYNQGSVTVNPTYIDGTYNYNSCAFYTGEIGLFDIPGSNPSSSPKATILPMLFRLAQTSEGDPYSYVLPAPQDDNVDIINGAYPNFKRLQSPVEIVSESFTISNLDDLEDRSFKTEANHDFGIVYYDQRGRHGFVNPLKTVFVEGYTDAERPQGGGKGRVEIQLTLQHSPPQWAHQYKIVYSKNTTVQDFVQYNTGGGFVSQNLDDQEVSEANQNIYVSLNYLQGHPISYVSSFGARTPEGGLNFYKFQEGDKLRVISYFEGTERKYVDVEFDVVDVVKLGGDDNPLSDSPVPDFLQGDFVVLKNNPSAFGFSYGETLAGASKWGDNCIIELRTPLKDVDGDQRVFYEMSETYDVVINSDDELVHDQEVLTLKNGDVWFRPVATNTREYENGQYVDLIGDTDNASDPPAQPNFKNVFLETGTATDLFRADNIGLGRPNFILKNAKETVRESTITYSDPSNPEGKRLNYSSFNASLANFKDLPERFGGLQYMSDYDEFVFAIQEDKVSVVPVNKNILSDASGTSMVIASKEILGKAVFYPGQNGCDNDPSSVFDSGQEAYFCNKTLSKVYRWTKQSGVEEISNAGMSSVIRASIQRAMSEGGEVRIVGGYDPLKEEYLFTILKPAHRDTTNVGYLVQPDQYIEPPTGVGGEEDDDPIVGESPVIEASTDSIAFAAANSDDEPQEQELIIFNTGTADLLVSALTIGEGETKNGESAFKVNGPVASSNSFYIQPGQKESVFVEMNPENQSGDISAQLIIENSSENRSLFIPLSSTVTFIEPEYTLGEFQQSWNNFYLNHPEIAPTQYPLTSDEQMSAELAFNYIHDLRVNSPEEITWGELRDFLSDFSGDSMYMVAADAAIDSNNNIGIEELFSFLGMFDTNFGEFTSLNVSEDLYTTAIVASDVTDSGGIPVPFNGGETPPEVNLFGSTQEALDFIVSNADMTVAQFHFLNSLIKPKVKSDFDGDGIIGTGDLMDLLQYYALPIPGAGEPAFINPSPIELEGDASGSETNNAIFWLSLNGSDMTAQQYWNFAANIRPDVKTDLNGDGIVGTNDHVTILQEWSLEQAGEPATPLDPNTLAFN